MSTQFQLFTLCICLMQMSSLIWAAPLKFQPITSDDDDKEPEPIMGNEPPLQSQAELLEHEGHIDAATPDQMKKILKDQTHKLFHHGKEIKELDEKQKDLFYRHHNLNTAFDAHKVDHDHKWHAQHDINENNRKNHKNLQAHVINNQNNLIALNEEQEVHAAKIEQQRADHEAFVANANQKFGEHDEHLGKHDKHLEKHSGKLAEHKSELGVHTQQIGGLRNDLTETNKQVELHGDKLQAQDIVIKNAVNDISDLNVAGERRDKQIAEQKHNHEEHVVKTAKNFTRTDDKLAKVDNELGVQNGRLDGHDAMLGVHGTQIQGLQGDLQSETEDRKKVDAEHAAQLSAHQGQLNAHGQKLGEHEVVHGQLDQGIKAAKQQIDQVEQQRAVDQANNLATFTDHQTQITNVKGHANQLEGQLNEQGQSLQQAHQNIGAQQVSLDNAHQKIGEHTEILGEHTRKLTENRHNVQHINGRLDDHQSQLVDLHAKNAARKQEIDNLETDVNVKYNEQKDALGQTNVKVVQNTEQIGVNEQRIDAHGVKLGEHEVLLDKYGNQIVIHDSNFVKHDNIINQFEKRLNNNDQNLQAIVEKQNEVDNEMLDVQKKVNELVLKSEQQVLEATKKAVENMNDAATLLEANAESVKEKHAEQQAIIANQIANGQNAALAA